MLAMAISLTVAAVLFELALAVRFRALLASFRRNALAGVGASIGLSWLLGSIFGASGMIVMFAAVASTVVTGLLYSTGIVETVLSVQDRVSAWQSSRA